MSHLNKYIQPLLRLKYRNRTSHMIGSYHCVELSNLSYDGSIGSGFNPNYRLISFLKSRKTLITEPGTGHLGYTRYLDDVTESSHHTDKLAQLKLIYQESNPYTKIVSLYKNIMDSDELNRYKKHYIANKYDLNILYLLKWNKDPLYEVVNEIRDIYPEVLGDNKISLTFMGLILYSYIVHNGMDMNLVVSYLEENKKVYSLDEPIKGNLNPDLGKRYHVIVRRLALTIILHSVITRIAIIDILKKEILSRNWLNQDFQIETSSIHNDDIVVTKRNRDWIPWITRYHLETEDPLFVVGRDHLNGKYGLVNLLRHQGWELDILTDY